MGGKQRWLLVGLPPVGQQQLPVQLMLGLGSFNGADGSRRRLGLGSSVCRRTSATIQTSRGRTCQQMLACFPQLQQAETKARPR